MGDLTLRVAAKALIRHKGKVLLMREPEGIGTEGGKYQIPGGGIDPGEKFLDALKREIKEETGLQITPVMPLMIDEWFPEINGQRYHNIAIFYLCDSVSDKVRLSHEHDDFVWIKPEEVGKYKTTKQAPELMRAYKKFYE